MKANINTIIPITIVIRKLYVGTFLLSFSFVSSLLMMYVIYKSLIIVADASMSSDETVDITAARGAARKNPAATEGIYFKNNVRDYLVCTCNSFFGEKW